MARTKLALAERRSALELMRAAQALISSTMQAGMVGRA
jgi:hypothetical protein